MTRPARLFRCCPVRLGHSWQAMAFNPKTGFVYIPAQEIGMTYGPVKDFKMAPIGWNIGVDATFKSDVKGYLLAWDPVKQKEVWRANNLGPWNGGILTTAGNLVIEGNAAGFFNAFRADTGEKLWTTSVQSAVMAAPVTYEIGGEQYIAVLSGWGGAYPLMQGKGSDKSGNTRNISRVLVFKLGGKTVLPPLPAEPELLVPPLPDTASAETVAAGEALFNRFCSVCHGQAAVGGGVVPDLRTSPFIAVDAWYSIVLDGALRQGGMAPFAPTLDHAQASAIRDYVIHRAMPPMHRTPENPLASRMSVMARLSWHKAPRPALQPARNVTPLPARRTPAALFRGSQDSRPPIYYGSCWTSGRVRAQMPSCRRSPGRCRPRMPPTWPLISQARSHRFRLLLLQILTS